MIPSLAVRVARRHLAREFPTDKALKKYLQEHPQADKSKHHVVDEKEKGSKDGDHGEHDEHDDDEGMLERLKGALKTVAHKVKDAPKDVQKFVADREHRKEALKKGVKAMWKAPGKYLSQLAKVAKHEVHEFKTAGQGLKAVMKGDKPSSEQKKAIKAVAVHMGITVAAAVLTTATPALASLAVGKAMGKHMALKAALKVLGDLHVLEEVGHIGHGVGHVLQTLTKLGADQDEKKASPEELLAALVMKHIGELMEDMDDDTLAEAMGADGGEAEDETQQKEARRVAAAYVGSARGGNPLVGAVVNRYISGMRRSTRHELKKQYELAKSVLAEPADVPLRVWLLVIKLFHWGAKMVDDPTGEDKFTYKVTAPNGKSTLMYPKLPTKEHEAEFDSWMRRETGVLEQLENAVRAYETPEPQRTPSPVDLGVPVAKADFSQGRGRQTSYGEWYTIDFGLKDERGRAIGCIVNIRPPDERQPEHWSVDLRAARDGKWFGASHRDKLCSTRAEAESIARKGMLASFKRYSQLYSG